MKSPQFTKPTLKKGATIHFGNGVETMLTVKILALVNLPDACENIPSIDKLD